MSQTFSEEDILEAVSEVVDPEINVPILEMGEPNGLVDEVVIGTDNSI